MNPIEKNNPATESFPAKVATIIHPDDAKCVELTTKRGKITFMLSDGGPRPISHVGSTAKWDASPEEMQLVKEAFAKHGVINERE